MTPASDLTICSVSFRSSHFLDLNWQLTASLNPPPAPAWIVVENSPPAERLAAAPGTGFTIVPGGAPPADLPAKVVGSYHHAAALQQALPHLQSRFALFLDPDFYLVRPDWIALVLRHMAERELAFFGVPWHPRWFVKYRAFPCVHCLFVDLSRVAKDELDFQPDDLAGSAAPAWRKSLERKLPGALWSLYRGGRKTLLALSQIERRQIGQRCDTGTRIQRRFAERPAFPSETAQPVFDEERDALAPAHARSRVARRLERVLPERFRFFPERSSFTRRDFAARGFPSAGPLGCEEFVWQDQPFGFHFRGTAQTPAHRAERTAALRHLIDAFRERAAGPR